ncbi:hypothetical protein [Halosimplex sp. J119]
MTRARTHRILSIVLGIATGVGLWWLGTYPDIAVTGGIAMLVLGLVVSRLVREYPAFTSADRSWRDNRWSALGQVFVILVTFTAVYAAPLEFADRIGLLVVVFATYFVGYTLGGLDALELDVGDEREESTGSADPADD